MIRARWQISTGYPDGWCVAVTVGDRTIERYYGATGGEWAMASGVLGAQIVGTCDVRAPRSPVAFSAWVRRRLAAAVRDTVCGAS